MIEIRNLAKQFAGVQVLTEVNLKLHNQDFVLLYGPSGSGKTTLLRLLAGLDPVSEGQILFDGKVFSAPGLLVPPHKRSMGFVFQEPSLWPHLTVAANIRFACQGSGKQKEISLNQLAGSCKLSGLLSKFPGQLSMGEKRRVALARSLAARPDYLLLDEALVNLDPDARKELLDLLIDLKKQQGFSLIYVSHSTEDQAIVSARIWHCLGGGINEKGS